MPRIFERGYTGLNGRTDKKQAAWDFIYAEEYAKTLTTEFGPNLAQAQLFILICGAENLKQNKLLTAL